VRSIIIFFVMAFTPALAFAGITFTNGAWSTTFDCSEWVQNDVVSCDGLENYGAWTANGQGDQITADADNPVGGGGKGFRHWEAADNPAGSHHNGGGLSVVFPSAQNELWVRWYSRHQSGFAWSGTIGYDKILYFFTGKPNCAVIAEYTYENRYSLIAQDTSNYYQVFGYHGWVTVNGGSTGDGQFHCFELHLKMDTNQSDGIGQIWIDGDLVADNAHVDWSNGDATAKQGWTSFLIGSNQSDPVGDTPQYVDFDDMVVYNGTPPNHDAQGKAFIGPIGWGGDVDVPPAAPEGVTVQ